MQGGDAMRIKEAILIKKIEFTSKTAIDRYFYDLARAGKGFRCLTQGTYDDKGKTKHYVIVAETCGYPALECMW